MIGQNDYIERIQRFWFLWFPATVGIGSLALLALWVQLSFAQQAGQRTFASPQQAAHALFTAVQNDDEESILQILGGRKELVSSTDEVRDKVEREQFAEKYQEMHRLLREQNGTMVLFIGAENWSYPVPIVSKGGQWFFDCDAGAQEILFRRVGENESVAIETSRALVSATKPLTNVSTAQRVSSQPFHGYYFRPMVTPAKQGTASNKSEAGPVFVAYPAEYRVSGVITFVVTGGGTVFQKDLGTNTSKTVTAMSSGSLDSSWQIVE